MNKMRRNLFAEDEDDVLDALHWMGGNRVAVSEHEITRILSLLGSSSEEIRERSAFVAGIHYKWIEACDLIIERLINKSEEGIYIISCLVRSVGSIGRCHSSKKDKCSAILAQIIMCSSRHRKERGIAYNELMAMWGKLSPAEYAIAPDDITKINVDEMFVSSFR